MNLQGKLLLATLVALTVTMLVAAGCSSRPNEGNSSGNQPDVADGGETPAEDDIHLSDEQMEKGKEIFFNRCAGCHGVLRKGATGPNIEPANTKKKGTAYLEAMITNGSPAGMPEWGKSGILSPDEVKLMARYVQNDPPAPPERSLKEMKESHKVYVAVDKRPTAPPAGRNWQNYFGVVLRDVGKVAIIDGDTYELINLVNSGFAVHILRSSASGRYFYSIGRDGKVGMIDLWMEKPDIVAEVKVVNEARSVETTKFEGFRDKYLIVGGYWPPMLVIMKGDTLEPIRVVSTSSYEIDEGSFVREARVAAIVADHHGPNWIANIKETGQVWVIDYSQLGDGTGPLGVKMVEAERYLHDGGWDSSGRYLLMAANARNTISVIDTQTQELVANIDTKGVTPHPGRGANIKHSVHGPMWATGHIGSGHITYIGTDPENHKDKAWKVVAQTELPGTGGGNLFVKTHPNSGNLYVDRPLNPDKMLADTIYVIDAETLKLKKELVLPEEYRGHKAVHMEYNKQGTEVWVAAWGRKDQQGAIIVYDDKTLEVKKIITGDWMVTPTGKFNVFNTMNDIY
jgi:nitrite reductase (NO-forming)/hydroxylamine reductase